MSVVYDFSTCKAVQTDAVRDFWEVQALGDDGQWWTVSDRGQLDQSEAEFQAAEMRKAALLRELP